MSEIKLEYLSALEIGELVNDKKITPTEVLEYFEKRIKERNKSINAFTYTKFDEAYKEALKLEERLKKGEYCGMFAGVPFALKDFLPSKKGWTHSYGGVKCLVSTDEYNSLFCEVMESEGGIAIGKTNAPSYGFSGTTDNKMYGATSTPFNTLYNSGGSSGGSAAAVADGLVPIAEGGDAGGSIRVPASCCNLVGFKAGFGSIPLYSRPDAYSASHPYCVGGGLVKHVKDAIALYKLMAKVDLRDPYNNMILRQNEDLDSYINAKHNLKIAFTYDFDIFEVSDEVKKIVFDSAKKFESMGYLVEEVHFNFKHSANEFSEEWCKGITIDCALDLNHAKEEGIDYLGKHSSDFPDEFIHYKKICDELSIEDLYKFNLARTDILDNFEDVFENYDLIISPVTCTLPVKNNINGNTKGPEEINGKKVDSLIGWCQTYLANFVSYPAISIPAGIGSFNLPVGMQIIGKRFEEKMVLKAALDYEKNYPWIDNFEIPFNRKIK
ncbi:MAG: amidase [Acholeplasmatales bacterium]|nr:amidase [Acholeplasmatales bacterium]